MTEEAPSTPALPVPPSRLTGLQSTVYLATYFIRFGFGATLSLYAFYLGKDFEASGLAAAAAPAVEAVSVLFAGVAADRYGRFPVMTGGLVLGTVVLLGMASTRDLAVQGMLNALFGISSAAILASSLAVTGDLHTRENAGRAMGWFDAVNLFGWISGFSSGYFMVSFLDGVHHPARLSVAFLVGAGAVFVALVVVLVRTSGLTEEPPLASLDLQAVRRAVLDPDILLVVLPWGAIYMLIGALLFYLGPAADSVHLPLWELGAAIFVGGSLLLGTQPFYGRLADRWGRARVMAIGIVGFLAVLAGAGVLLADPRAPPMLSYGMYGLVGIGGMAALALGPSSLAALSDLAAKTSRATTMALYGVVIASGMAAGLLLYTALAHALGNRGIAIFFGVVGVSLGVVTLVRLYRSAHRQGRAATL